MKKQYVQLAFALLIVFLSACSPSTRITGSWVDPAARQHPINNNRLFIASLTRNMEARTKLESSLAVQAAARNIKTVRSVDTFSPEFYKTLPSKKTLLSKIQGSGATSLLTVTLIKRVSHQHNVRGNMAYMPYLPFGYYGGFYNYYNFMYPGMYDPEFSVADQTYFLESNLYDARTGKLIWSAQSETINPGSLNAFVKEYPKVLLAQMAKDGLLKE